MLSLFKFDACCSNLSTENQKYFIQSLNECRKAVPDLIVLNHRISLSEEAEKLTTTWLWEGKETYIDVHMPNSITAPHHRAGALSRNLVPNLQRLTEDHGVCISSCLDYWEDDLILQAFNRNLILAPEIYGNPWLLKDEEFPKLAGIYNLHRKYRNILVTGMVLPSQVYGENAVSRGNEGTRLITLRNLSWTEKTVKIKLDKSIGLETKAPVEVRQYHPYERIYGIFKHDDEVEIEVLPFRSCLIIVSDDKSQFEPGIKGCDFEIVRNIPGYPLEINLLGFPGSNASILLEPGNRNFSKVIIENKPADQLLSGKSLQIGFEGEKLKSEYHRKIADFQKVAFPVDAEGLYEATCFAADNNALEVRSVIRSGETKIPEVERARDAFLDRDIFKNKGIWDKNLFDSDLTTNFNIASFYRNRQNQVFRLNLGMVTKLDSMVFRKTSVSKIQKIETSIDLIHWNAVEYTKKGDDLSLAFLKENSTLQFLRIFNSPDSVTEIEGYFDGKKVNSTGWKASNLFNEYKHQGFSEAWAAGFKLTEIAKNSYIAVAVPGSYEPESVYAGIKVKGKLRGFPDRAISYPSNTWEAPLNKDTYGNSTYYFPINSDWENEDIEIFLLGNPDKIKSINAEAWITSYPVPHEKLKMILE